MRLGRGEFHCSGVASSLTDPSWCSGKNYSSTSATTIINKYSTKAKLVVTVEEHNILGGLGGAVAEVASQYANAKVLRIGINDHFSGIGTPEYLMEDEGLTKQAIVDAIIKYSV